MINLLIVGVDDDLVGYHEAAVEAQTEMADDVGIVILSVGGVLGDKVSCAGEGDLSDILFDLLGGHSDAVIGNLQRTGLLVDNDVHAIGGFVGSRLAGDDQAFVLADGVAGIADQLAHKDILVGVQPLLDNGHDIFSIDRYSTFSKHN